MVLLHLPSEWLVARKHRLGTERKGYRSEKGSEKKTGSFSKASDSIFEIISKNAWISLFLSLIDFIEYHHRPCFLRFNCYYSGKWEYVR